MDALLTAVVVSACLGALIGLIRQWSEQRSAAQADFGGVRTFTLWGLIGCVGSYVSQNHLSAMLPVALVLIAAQFIAVNLRETREGRPGNTSFAAMLLTCLVGALVQWGQMQAAALLAALTMVTLGSKKPLHAWTLNFTQDDIRATLQFAAITGVILPLVPNRSMGPYEAFNPFSTWLMVVLISGIGFAGYILMRLLGTQAGITLTGIAGGLASSTATTLTFSRRSKEDPDRARSYALAVVLACTIMPARVLFVVGLINQELFRSLLLPIAATAVPGLIYSGWNWYAQRKTEGSVDTPDLRNPLSLKTAVKFAVLYAIFAFLVKAATQTSWKDSLLPLSFLSGLTDMDAIALLMANSLREHTVVVKLATEAVITGAIGSAVAKGGMAVVLGAGAVRSHVGIVLGATIAVGVAALMWV
ncbi:hypothetical protein DB347_22090 [Opitutaceae bacterium EW11]|nr:hypothetical protein DB347_22090 [Opitutaceae bacterium EW11]